MRHRITSLMVGTIMVTILACGPLPTLLSTPGEPHPSPEPGSAQAEPAAGEGEEATAVALEPTTERGKDAPGATATIETGGSKSTPSPTVTSTGDTGGAEEPSILATPEEPAGDLRPSADASSSPSASLTLVNNLDREICYVYISPTDSDDWGEDWLGVADTVPPGGSHTFSLPAGTYDVRAEDCEGNALDEVFNASIDGPMKWTLSGPSPPSQEEPPAPRQVALDQFLCCGSSPGGTNIWSISYPNGWQVELLPNNPNEFFGANISDPTGNIIVSFIPGAMTLLGTAMDTGDVDQFLDALLDLRRQEHPGFEEFLRQSVEYLPDARIWAGTWGHGSDRRWQSYLVIVNPIQFWVEGLPRGYLTMFGLEASSQEWANGVNVFQDMLDSMKVKRIGDPAKPADFTQEGVSEMGKPSVEPFLVRWCPRCCDWIAVEASQDDWACPRCGTETELWETPCIGHGEDDEW